MKNMKRLWGILTALAVVFPFLAYGQSESYYDRSYARMSYIQGDVFVQRAQNQGYEKGEINLVVVQGDKLGSRSGRLEIQLGLRNYLRLDNDTQVDLVSLPGRDGDPTKLHVLAGSVFLRVYSLDRPKNYEIHTPDASFYILTAGLYRVDVRENRETEFSVISGSAEAAGEEGSVTVEDGQRISAANGRFTTEAGSLLARRDDFAAWNETREGFYARGTTGRSYLPAQYADYETELDDNGRWVEEADYGYVWVPRVSYADWRPYSNGRWVWYPIIGWTWVSYDSWGWCTHHYGRWGWGLDLGWYWIPTNYWGWGPAWVNWWYDSDYIGWCPLSYWGYPAVIYDNCFYGRYGFGEYNRFGYFARTMTVVDRNQLWDRNICRSALSADRLLSRTDRISLDAHQPDIRPRVNRADGIASRAASVLGRENLRPVGRGYGGNGTAGGGLAIRSRETVSGNTGRQIRSYSSDGNSQGGLTRSQSSTRSGETGSSSTLHRYEGNSGSSSSSDRRIREYSGSGRSSSSSGALSRSTTGRNDAGTSSSMRSFPSRSTGSSSGRDTSSRSSSSSRISSGVREYGSRSSVGRPDGSSSYSRSYSAPSRSYSAPSRSYSAPSRSYDSSRSYSAPSRSYSAPSRSYSAPSRSYDSSRSYSAPSRSYSAPSRSYDSSRSYSAPSRSYSEPSRSYSAPSRSYDSSRSYSAPSHSYSEPSRSSSSSGSSRSSSSSSSGRSSGGSARRR